MIVFIDFDGVLHPVRGQDKFQYLPSLLELLDEFPDIRIVVSSSWRTIMDEAVLESMFERHACKFIGTTGEMEAPGEVHGRMLEIQSWIIKHEYTGPWLAVDDAVEEFSSDCPNLFVCDPNKGLEHEALQRLRKRLNTILNKTGA